MNPFANVKNFADVKKIVELIGAEQLKALAPLLAGLVPVPAGYKASDEAKLRASLANIITNLIDVVDNVDQVS